jgi:hypothetical protein
MAFVALLRVAVLPGDRPIGFMAIYVASLVFSLPIFVFRSPYAAVGGMTIAHGFQYLVLIGLIGAGGASVTARAVKLAVLVNVALWVAHS